MHIISKKSLMLTRASRLDLVEVLIDKGGDADVRNNDGKSVRMLLSEKFPEADPEMKLKIEALLKKLEVKKTSPELKVFAEQPLFSALRKCKLKTAFILNLFGGNWKTR